MLPGIPPKKASFKRFSGDRCIDVCIIGRQMYVLYSCTEIPVQGAASFLKCIDLEVFDGDFDSQPNHYEANVTGLRSICPGSNVLMISGWKPEVLSLDELSPIYSETDRKLNPEWDDFGWVYYWDGRVYRGYENAQEKGVDVIDLKSQRIINKLDFYLQHSRSWNGSLIFGDRQNGNYLIYCLDTNRVILDVCLESYRQVGSSRWIVSCVESDFAYVLVDDHLLVFNLNTAELVREIKYLSFSAIQEHMRVENMDVAWACASTLSVYGGEVLLSNVGISGYVLYLAPFRDESFVWFWSAGQRVVARNSAGDLVFGLSGTIPMAWDKYTGEVVWDTKKPTATSKIAVGDQWVVFSQTSEYIQGHHWKKPYISPHRPKAE